MWSKKDQDGLTERSGQRAFPFKGQCCKSNITKASWLGVKKNDWVNPNTSIACWKIPLDSDVGKMKNHETIPVGSVKQGFFPST